MTNVKALETLFKLFRVIKFRVLNGKIITLPPSPSYTITANALNVLISFCYFYRILKGISRARFCLFCLAFQIRKCEKLGSKKEGKKLRGCFQMNFLAILIATCYMIMVSVSCGALNAVCILSSIHLNIKSY